MRSRWVPRRGDLVWLDFDPQAGHEQRGTRPAAVLSPATYNAKVGLAVCCPITSHAKGYPFEVALPPDSKVQGVVLADHLKSLDWRARHAKWIERLPTKLITEILAKARTLLE
jgi:mRNA interferase MazF